MDGTVVASVPDLITLCDSNTGFSFSTEETKYGLRASVLVMTAPPILRSERALKVVGPKAFGYDIEYKPNGEFIPVKSVFNW